MSAFTNDYSAILNDLNRDVLRQRPTDILQFCADWFQTRLRDHRRVLSQGQDAATTTPTSTSSASRLQNVNPFGAVSASSSASVTSPFSGASPSAAPPASLAAPAVVTSNTHQQQQRDSISSSSTSSDPDAFIPPPAFNLGRRESVSAESLAPSLGPSSHDADGKLLPKTVIPKTDSQKARIKASIGSNLLFRQLDEQQSNDVLLAMKEVKVDKDHIVIRQGDQGDFFYVVESGTLDVHIDPKLSSSFNNSIPRGGLAGRGSVGSTTSSDSTLGEDLGHHPPTTQGGSSIPHGQTAVSFLGEYKSSYGPSSAFGELALLYLQPRAASIVSTSPCVLWAVDRVTFRSILTETNGRKRWTLEKFLRKVSLFDTLDSSRIAKLADALHIREYKVGDRIITQGEPGREFFIVLSGELMVQRRRAEGEEEVQVGHVIAGEYFGELALLNNAPRAASVVAAKAGPPLSYSTSSGDAHDERNNKIQLAILSEEAFRRLVGSLTSTMERHAEEHYYHGGSAGAGATVAAAASPLPSSAVDVQWAPHDVSAPSDPRGPGAGTWVGGLGASPFGAGGA